MTTGGADLRPPAPGRVPETDRTDRTVLLVPTRAAFALVALLAMAVGVVVWSSVAVVDRTTVVPGVSLVGGAAVRIVSPIQGQLVDAVVSPGTAVRGGTLLAVVRGPSGEIPVLAPSDGTVLVASFGRGAALQAGETLALIEPAEGLPVVRVFVDPVTAASLSRGSRAVVEFVGRAPVDATVRAVAALPVSAEQASDSLGARSLGTIVAPRDGLVPVVLTAAGGSSFPRPEATTAQDRLCAVRLIVESRRPIEYVI